MESKWIINYISLVFSTSTELYKMCLSEATKKGEVWGQGEKH